MTRCCRQKNVYRHIPDTKVYSIHFRQQYRKIQNKSLQKHKITYASTFLPKSLTRLQLKKYPSGYQPQTNSSGISIRRRRKAFEAFRNKITQKSKIIIL